MNKFAIASIIALAATAASAFELGVTGTRDYVGADRTGYGVTLGQKFGKAGVEAGFTRFTAGTNDQDRYSLVGSYDVAKLGPVNLAVKAGGAYLQNQTGANGYAAVVGAGASFPVTNKMSVGLDVVRQYGQDRVNQFDGTQATASVKVSF